MKKLAKALLIAGLAFAGWPHLAGAQAPDARTKRTFKAKCAACHGEDGKGQTAQARQKFGGLRDLSDPAVQKRFDDAKLKEIVQKGLTETKDGKEIKMPATPEIAGEQLDGMVRFVRGLAGGK